MIEDKITLSGFAGTGKSTIGKILEDKLKYKFISIGNYSRDFAQNKYGLTINQFQEKCKKEPELDKQIDNKFKKYCNEETSIIVDYRLGFKFIRNSFNVLLKVSDEVALSRIENANRKNEDVNKTSINRRNQIMRERFLELYDVDFIDEKNYHLVIQTDNLKPEEIAELIILNFEKLVKPI